VPGVLAPWEANGVATFQADRFTVGVSEGILADLRARIQHTRWPEGAPGLPWEQGTDLGYLRELLGYWAAGFDWRAQERWLNSFRNFRAGIDGVRVHFVHERARSGHGIPLILTHGWPSCFAEFLPRCRPDPGIVGQDRPLPAQPRRRPAGQPCPVANRVHPPGLPPGYPRLRRAPHPGRKIQGRDHPLPQALRRPRGLPTPARPRADAHTPETAWPNIRLPHPLACERSAGRPRAPPDLLGVTHKSLPSTRSGPSLSCPQPSCHPLFRARKRATGMPFKPLTSHKSIARRHQ
jgi:hypothetical protein